MSQKSPLHYMVYRGRKFCFLRPKNACPRPHFSCIYSHVRAFFFGVLAKTQFVENAKTQFENTKTQFENAKTQFEN